MWKTNEADRNMTNTTETPTQPDETLDELLRGAVEPDALPADTMAASCDVE